MEGNLKGALMETTEEETLGGSQKNFMFCRLLNVLSVFSRRGGAVGRHCEADGHGAAAGRADG